MIFDNIRKAKQAQQTKVTAGKVDTLSKVCPVCGTIMEKAYSKGIPVLVCVKHNIVLPDIGE